MQAILNYLGGSFADMDRFNRVLFDDPNFRISDYTSAMHLGAWTAVPILGVDRDFGVFLRAC